MTGPARAVFRACGTPRDRGLGHGSETEGDAGATTASSRPGRIAEHESFLDLIDQLAYGDLPACRRLYAAAIVDAATCVHNVRAAQRVDPDFVTAGRVWQALIARMPR